MDDIIVVIVISVLILLAIQFFLAEEFYKVAVMKGYDEKRYLWLSFLFGLVGYLLVIALPQKATSLMSDDELPEMSDDELPEL